MRYSVIVTAVCFVSALALVYAAYGQSREDLDNLEQSKKHIALLEKVEDAIKTIQNERKPAEIVQELEFIDVADIHLKIPNFAGPDVRVFEPGRGEIAGGGISFNGDEDAEGEPFGPEELIELVKSRTGEENWPEEEGGFGTIELHRNSLIVCHTPEMIQKVKDILNELREFSAALISSSVYLLAAPEEYLQGIRRTGSSVITPEAIIKIIADAHTGEKVQLLRTAYLTAYSSQSAYVYDGIVHTYIGDTDTSGAGGQTPVCIFDPVINIFREGLVVGLRTQYNRQTEQVNVVAHVALCKLTAIEEYMGIGGGTEEEPKTCKIETPKVDLQIVAGSADVPEKYGLLIGGSRLKTTQAEQKSFVVLVVPQVQK